MGEGGTRRMMDPQLTTSEATLPETTTTTVRGRATASRRVAVEHENRTAHLVNEDLSGFPLRGSFWTPFVCHMRRELCVSVLM